MCSHIKTLLLRLLGHNKCLQKLESALNCKHKEEDINALHHFDNDDDFNGMAILHRLVTSRYANQTELVMTLMTFSNADINLKTGNGKTAFHLAVEVYTVELLIKDALNKGHCCIKDNFHGPSVSFMQRFHCTLGCNCRVLF